MDYYSNKKNLDEKTQYLGQKQYEDAASFGDVFEQSAKIKGASVDDIVDEIGQRYKALDHTKKEFNHLRSLVEEKINETLCFGYSAGPMLKRRTDFEKKLTDLDLALLKEDQLAKKDISILKKELRDRLEMYKEERYGIDFLGGNYGIE
jgi:hypothetical protein